MITQCLYHRVSANQGFLAKAPPEVVEEQRERRTEAARAKAKLDAALDRLSAM